MLGMFLMPTSIGFGSERDGLTTRGASAGYSTRHLVGTRCGKPIDAREQGIPCDRALEVERPSRPAIEDSQRRGPQYVLP